VLFELLARGGGRAAFVRGRCRRHVGWGRRRLGAQQAVQHEHAAQHRGAGGLVREASQEPRLRQDAGALPGWPLGGDELATADTHAQDRSEAGIGVDGGAGEEAAERALFPKSGIDEAFGRSTQRVCGRDVEAWIQRLALGQRRHFFEAQPL
jgi:hypothetical protein